MKLPEHVVEKLRPHVGHSIECIYFGRLKDPTDIDLGGLESPHDLYIECVTCDEKLVSIEDLEEDDTDD